MYVIIASSESRESWRKAANARFGTALTARDIEQLQSGTAAENNGEDTDGPRDARSLLLDYGRRFLRKELTDLEQFVLIQIFDQSWKDHLYAMDMLKAGIGLQAFAEKDPRIAYKKEGFRYFEEMMAGVRDKVTDLIFRARVVGQTQARSAYRVTEARHDATDSYGVTENLRETADLVPAGGGGGGEMQASSGDGESEA